MKATAGCPRVVGDGMIGKAVHVKRGDLRRRVGPVFMLGEPKSRKLRAGVRAPIGARKRL